MNKVAVKSFQRSTEPSFPENEMLPKKDEAQFDKRFNEWWDDVKMNLSRLDDQISKFVKAELNESITFNKQETDVKLSSLDEESREQIASLNAQNATLQSEIQAVKNNLYSQ